jgi:hypothetical protein
MIDEVFIDCDIAPFGHRAILESSMHRLWQRIINRRIASAPGRMVTVPIGTSMKR